MFKGMDSREFYGSFKTEDHCRKYLYKIKWKHGFCCRRCRHDKFWPGQTRFHARCRICNYDESVTAHTVFHKIQFSLLKAFDLTFHLTVLQKGLASRNLAAVVGVNPKTALYFMHKVRKSMGDWLLTHVEKEDVSGNCTIDSIIITHRASNMNGLQKVKTMIKRTAKQKYIHFKASPQKEKTLDPCHLVAGRYVDDGKKILAWNLKSWLTGVHHHCSEKYRQNYLDEYSFKFCFRNNKNIILHKLIEWMVVGKRNEYQRYAA
ncbi:MAG: transposase [Chitinophagaceae bacterium]|nr:MAG: transposase [Chitinophagaceae bacterium]